MMLDARRRPTCFAHMVFFMNCGRKDPLAKCQDVLSWLVICDRRSPVRPGPVASESSCVSSLGGCHHQPWHRNLPPKTRAGCHKPPVVTPVGLRSTFTVGLWRASQPPTEPEGALPARASLEGALCLSLALVMQTHQLFPAPKQMWNPSMEEELVCYGVDLRGFPGCLPTWFSQPAAWDVVA